MSLSAVSVRRVAEYEFPADLVAIQRAIFAAQERTAAAALSSDEAFQEAHRAEQDAVMAKDRHPFWEIVPQPQRHQTDLALREAARE